MQIFHPTTVDEVIGLLAAHDEARCLAGGQTLVAMLNLGLLDPPALISLRKVAGLDRLIRHADGGVTMGATVTQAALAAADLPGALAVLGLKFARVDGDYATVSVAVTMTLENGVCRAARIALGSCAARPLRLDAADAALADTGLDADSVARAGALLQEAADPLADMRGTADYRRRIVPGLVARAIGAARAKAEAPA